ncbi:MAG TPA: hypothetical protein VE088_07010 [Gaiellaceae bacterium]|jgi:hypothetical protein|nr:hypothetical protein [Gaiellaceae bacterium]
MARLRTSPDRTVSLALLRLAPVVALVAWLVVAGYALTYVLSH